MRSLAAEIREDWRIALFIVIGIASLISVCAADLAGRWLGVAGCIGMLGCLAIFYWIFGWPVTPKRPG